MKQALHIFGKDARGLRLQILMVWGLFAIYSLLPPNNSGYGVRAPFERDNLPFLLIVLACWTLGASAVQEDAPALGSAFWLTRPYGRMSLLTAKALFLLAFVFLPLLVSGAVLEARAGVNVVANTGVLIVLQMERAAWLILPALVIGAITRSLTEFAGTLCALAVTLAFCDVYMARHWANLLSVARVPDNLNVTAILPLILAAIAAIGLQYAVRRTQWSRGLLAAAVIGSGFLIPLNGISGLSNRTAQTDFDLNRIRISFDETVAPKLDPKNGIGMKGTCASLILQVEGLPAGTVLREAGTKADVISDAMGIRPIQARLNQTNEGYLEFFCLPSPGTSTQDTLRTSLNLEVLAVEPIATIPASRGTFVAGDAGRCEILTPFPENTQLRCDLAEPVVGSIGAGLKYPGYENFAVGFGWAGPFGLSPVSRVRFDGVSRDTPGGWEFDDAFDRPDARFILRKERRLGWLQRELVYHRLVFPWTRVLGSRPIYK